ncbi:MAG: hypothetical protein ACR5K9_07085 [Wolbachia sp.]
MGYVINLLNFPIIAKKSSFSFVPLPMKLGITSKLSWIPASSAGMTGLRVSSKYLPFLSSQYLSSCHPSS